MTATVIDTEELTAGERASGREDVHAGVAPLEQVFFQMLTGYWVSKAIYVAARLGLADMVKDGPKTADELAARAGGHAPTLYRLLRALAGVGVFTDEGGGRFARSPLSKFLESGPGSMRGMTLHLMETASWRAWDGLLEAVQIGETAFSREHGVEIFPYYAEHPESAEPFNAAMVEFSAAVGAAVVEAYDFSGFEKIVDVGGGHGGLLTPILKENARARGVVFDQPQVADGAHAAMEAEGLADRVEVSGGDFFEAVPEGGDAYVLKFIVHDWDDERAITILRNCHHAMRDGGRLLLVETVVPEAEGPPLPKLMDVHMLVMTGGRERTAAEFRDLLARAGFEMTRVIPTNSPMCVVEAVKAGVRR